MASVGGGSDFLAKFIDAHKVPQDALDHFKKQEWLQTYLEDSSYKAIPTFASLTFPDEPTRIGILRRAVRQPLQCESFLLFSSRRNTIA